MPTILRNLPFFDGPTPILVRGQSIAVKRDQIVLWVSIAEKGLRTLHPDTPRFPAILDTGNNHNFLIGRRHLIDWAGIHPQHLRNLGSIRLHGRVVPQLGANVWLHPNRPNYRDELADRAPYLLECQGGIVVISDPADRGEPRLPVFGLRVIRWNNLLVSLDGSRRRVSIRTARRISLFG